MSCARFAEKHGLGESTLYRWSQLAGSADRSIAAGFAEVRIVGTAATPGIEVEHPGGCIVRVRGAVDEAQLAAVLRVLQTC